MSDETPEEIEIGTAKHRRRYWTRRIERGDVLTDDEIIDALRDAIAVDTPYGPGIPGDAMYVLEVAKLRIRGQYPGEYCERMRQEHIEESQR